MNRTLLNSALLVALASTTSGCGSDEGFGYQLDATDPVTMEREISITLMETAESSSERYITIGLLDGVTSQNVDLGETPGNVLIQDSSLEVSVLPQNKELAFANTTNPVVIKGFDLLVDTAAFQDQLTTGEAANYSISYWINNGFQFHCENMTKHPANCTGEERANNPNRRTVNITINALPDPLRTFELPDIVVGLNKSVQPTINFTPEFAADPGFIYEITSGDDIISISDDGLITGLALGNALITVTSSEDSQLTKTASVSVTNPPTNVASFTLTTPDGEMVGDTIQIPECTTFALTSSLTKVDDSQEFGGEFVYDLVSQDGAVDVDGFMANSGPIQSGYLSPITLNVTDTLSASLSGFGTVDDVITTTVETSDNIACRFADTSPIGPNMLNEEFLVYYNNGAASIDAFRQSTFIRNGQGSDANVDPTATLQIDPTNGKNGGAALRVTGDGSLPAAFYSYHRNTARALSVAFIEGGEFTISFWVKNNTNASVDLTNEIIAGDGRGTGAPVAGQFSDTPESQSTIIAANSDWKRVSFNVALPAVTSEQNVHKWEITLTSDQANNSNNPIDILFDDFAITSDSE
ncbi:hypothetical protein KO519_14130 [Paraglaciecola agarilytica]|uniref:hypothetical protein n=1 Tax=Paraglaciecola chathamensis TaxID=368405 RepID=UPI001C08A761|nr:hypothetical protein [Paraglaciecola agarilytica]MBU3018823.1 hypothetical protein [Paraglaciecola agarilytica]